MPDRPKLNHAVRNEFARTFITFYRAHPERVKDPAFEEDAQEMVALMDRVLRIIETYEIRSKVGNA